jgi:AraC family transcriptional regulator
MFPQSRLRVRDYGAGTAMAPHHHDEATLSIVVHGGLRERIGRRERDYARGHVAFFPAAMTHSQTFGPVGARQVTFRPPEALIDYLADCKVALDDAPYANAAIYRHLGDRLMREIGRDDAFSAVACEGLMLEVVAAFGRGGRARTTGARPPPWLRSAREFIRENALGTLGLAEIARAAGRHEIHLAREFSRYFGVSIGDYLRQLRTEHAARLLLHSHASLSEIALESGFSSHSHLCREFKMRLGVTPSHYRAQSTRTTLPRPPTRER